MALSAVLCAPQVQRCKRLPRQVCLSLLFQGAWISSQSKISSSVLRAGLLTCYLLSGHWVPVSFKDKLTLDSLNWCIILVWQGTKMFCTLLWGRLQLPALQLDFPSSLCENLQLLVFFRGGNPQKSQEVVVIMADTSVGVSCPWMTALKHFAAFDLSSCEQQALIYSADMWGSRPIHWHFQDI